LQQPPPARDSWAARAKLIAVFIWNNFIITILQILDTILGLYIWVVIASAVLTWVEPNPHNPIVRFVYSVTEPVLDWVRRKLPVFFGGIDFSPMVVIFGIIFIQRFFIPTVARLAVSGFN
jgi:YggT family protein